MPIVRTPTRALGGITAAEKAQLDAHAAKWIANAMRTDPVDPGRLTEAIRALYRAADLKEPRVVIASSPRVMAFAGGFAAAIWWLRAATHAATYAATRAATHAATDAATYAATRAATDAATDAATRAATDAEDWAVELADTLAREFGGNSLLYLQCAQRWWTLYQGGNMWSAWDCYLSAFRDVLGLRLPEHDLYRAWEACAIEGGFRVVHEEFCIVSDRPEVLSVDARNRPHGEAGPSHRWRDGWSLWYWHGVQVPQHVVESPESITLTEIRAERNAEVRRVMIERFGHERYCREAALQVVDQCSADHRFVGLRTARLLRDADVTLLDLLNSTPEPDGTVKRYVIPVDPDAYSGRAGREVLAAAASTWRKRSDTSQLVYARPEDYAPMVES
jgi:hypothetical protein